jgi:flagellar motor switch protein FliG
VSESEKRESTAVDKRKSSKLSGAQKGCLFIVSLEESVATRIMSHLSSDDVRKLCQAANDLKELEPGALTSVYQEFSEKLQKGVPTNLSGSGLYLKKLVGKALGDGVASEVWNETHDTQNLGAALANKDVTSLLTFIEREHDQTVAVILSQLSAAQANDILSRLSTERQVEIIRRLTQLQNVSASVIEDIEKQFTVEAATVGDSKVKAIDGKMAAVGLLKRMSPDQSETLIKELSAQDAALAEQLRPLLFTFEDLRRVDSRGMQLLLREVSREHLIVALKTASDEIKEKIFGSLSSRAVAVLRDELDAMGPVRVSDVEQAQIAIVEKALQLERENRITIAREGKSDYV